MPAKLRSIVRSAAFEKDVDRLLGDDDRAHDALTGLEWTLARLAEHGNAVRGHDRFHCWPFHTDRSSYLSVYEITADSVILVGLRRVAGSTFGD